MRALDSAFPEAERTGGLAPQRGPAGQSGWPRPPRWWPRCWARPRWAHGLQRPEPAPPAPRGPRGCATPTWRCAIPRTGSAPGRAEEEFEDLTLAGAVAVPRASPTCDDGELVAGRIASGRLPPQASAQVVDLRGVLGRRYQGLLRARLAPEGRGLRHPGRRWRPGDRGLCRSHRGTFASRCQRVASTVRARAGGPAPGVASPGYARSLAAAVRRVDRVRTAGRRRLARARTPAGQRRITARVARDYRRLRGSWPGSKPPRRPARATGGPSPSCAGRPAATPGWPAPPAPAGADAGFPHGTACGGPKATSRAPSAGSGGRDTTCGSHR